MRRTSLLEKIIILIGIIFIVNFFALYLYDVENVGVFLQGGLGIILIIFPIIKNIFLAIKSKLLKNGILIVLVLGIVLYSTIIIPMVYHSLPQEPQETDYLIVLGARVRGTVVSLPLKLRLDKSYEYLAKFKNTKVILAGGQGPGEDITEAEAMKRYLVAKGIDEKRIIKEDKSTSTYENILYSRKIVDKVDNNSTKTVCIVTNDYHMYRSKMLAKRNNFNPVGLPCGTYWQSYISSYLRESLAFIKSFLFDK